MRIDINITEQKLVFTHRNIRLRYSVSTSKYGEGFEEGSFRTPLGMHIICEKIGEAAECGAIFRDRELTGEIADITSDKKDIITSRILRLKGIQIKNKNTFDRYIYIHGTNQESTIGQKASIGCIRMKNWDIIDLFDHVNIGCKVYIHK